MKKRTRIMTIVPPLLLGYLILVYYAGHQPFVFSDRFIWLIMYGALPSLCLLSMIYFTFGKHQGETIWAIRLRRQTFKAGLNRWAF